MAGHEDLGFSRKGAAVRCPYGAQLCRTVGLLLPCTVQFRVRNRRKDSQTLGYRPPGVIASPYRDRRASVVNRT